MWECQDHGCRRQADYERLSSGLAQGPLGGTKAPRPGKNLSIGKAESLGSSSSLGAFGVCFRCSGSEHLARMPEAGWGEEEGQRRGGESRSEAGREGVALWRPRCRFCVTWRRTPGWGNPADPTVSSAHCLSSAVFPQQQSASPGGHCKAPPRGGRQTAPTACVDLSERVFSGSQTSADQNCRGQFIKPRAEMMITKVSTGGNGVTVLYHGHTMSCSQGDTPPTLGLTPSPPGCHPHHHHPAQTRCSIPSVLSLLFHPLPPSPPLRPQPQRGPEGQRAEDAKPSATHPPPTHTHSHATPDPGTPHTFRASRNPGPQQPPALAPRP